MDREPHLAHPASLAPTPAPVSAKALAAELRARVADGTVASTPAADGGQLVTLDALIAYARAGQVDPSALLRWARGLPGAETAPAGGVLLRSPAVPCSRDRL